MRLNAILGRFLSYGAKFDIGTSLTSKFFLAVWRFIIFRQQEGMHARLRVSLRETKTPSKNTKNKPQNLGRFAGIIGGMNNYLLRASRACFLI